jgi:Fe-S-cluster containining protein
MRWCKDELVKLCRNFLSDYRETEAAWLEAYKRQHPKAMHPACPATCTGCCNQLVLGSLISGVLIAADERVTPEVKERLKAQGSKQSGLLYHYGEEEAAHLWLESETPCALLQGDGLCSVYDIRPPMCSSYYVVPSSLCKGAKSKTRVSSIDNRRLIFEAVKADIAVLTILGQDPLMIVGPLGMTVQAGEALLGGPEAWEDFLRVDSIEAD